MLSVLSVSLLMLFLLHVGCKTISSDELCELGGRRIYLELGNYGSVVVRNRSKIMDSSGGRFKDGCALCHVEIVTCPSCVIRVMFNFSDALSCCSNITYCCEGCAWVHEAPYESTSSHQFCGCSSGKGKPTLEYLSQTRTVSIAFVYGATVDYEFSMDFVAEKNARVFPSSSQREDKANEITSPFFPAYYPPDLEVTYVINSTHSPNYTVRLVFTDFHISPSSIMEFLDSNGQILHVTSGNVFRPPILTSTGPTMIVKLSGNGGSDIGFRAVYAFLSKEKELKRITTDCGGYADNLGGAITIIDVIKTNGREYNCFWIIKPPKNFVNWKTHLFLTVDTFSGFGNSAELVIREGVTSNEPPVETINLPSVNSSYTMERKHVVPITKGFYVSLNGEVLPKSRLVIIYAAFSHKDCFSGTNFLCRNGRCISALLHCDGFNHCGDSSDEPNGCFRDPRIFHKSPVPNFYFPTINHYYDFKLAAVIFIICSLGIIAFIFGIIVLVYRINIQYHTQRHYQDNIETINAILEEGNLRIEEEEIIVADDPPDYEPPPTYDDIIISKCLSMKILKSKDSHNSRTRGEEASNENNACTSSSLEQTEQMPRSPPPAYSKLITRYECIAKLLNYNKCDRRFNDLPKNRKCLLVSSSDSDLLSSLDRVSSTSDFNDRTNSHRLDRSQSNESFLKTL